MDMRSMWRGWKGAGALVLLLSTQAQALEPFIEVGAGVTIFKGFPPDGVWYQQPFPHEFKRTDFGFRAGLGVEWKSLWSVTASYVHLGRAAVYSQVINDNAYLAHQYNNPTSPLQAQDRVQGPELTIGKKWKPFDMPLYPFVKGGGAFLQHHVTANGGSFVEDRWHPTAVVGGGVCYTVVCGEVSYYHALGGAGSPISKDALVPMLSLKIPF